MLLLARATLSSSPNVRISCFWTEDFPRPADLPTSQLPDRVDVAVVGGGYTGLAAARRLARQGAEVVVVDAGAIGGGASSVNGGMTIVGSKAPLEALVRRHGETLARQLWEASVSCVDLVERLVEEERIDCHFYRPGSAALGFTSRDEERFRRQAEWRKSRHFRPEGVVMPADRVVGSDRFAAALVEDLSGGLHPARYVYGLARAAAAAGASLVEHTRVRRIDGIEGRFLLVTGRGTLEATDVLVATDGYTEGLVPGLARRVFPGGSYIVVTDPLPLGVAEELFPGRRMLWTARWLLNYFRLTPDGRLLMGGRNNLSTDLDLTDSAGRLQAVIGRFFPPLSRFPISHSWGGRLGITFDLMPHIGRLGGIWYALGYSGHGVAMATYLGDEVARLIGGELGRSPFAEIPHPTRWFYRGRPWFLPLAAAWFRLRDRVGR